jgi:hypothetical protein
MGRKVLFDKALRRRRLSPVSLWGRLLRFNRPEHQAIPAL